MGYIIAVVLKLWYWYVSGKRRVRLLSGAVFELQHKRFCRFDIDDIRHFSINHLCGIEYVAKHLALVDFVVYRRGLTGREGLFDNFISRCY